MCSRNCFVSHSNAIKSFVDPKQSNFRIPDCAGLGESFPSSVKTTSMEIIIVIIEHNNNSTVSSPFPCQDNDSTGENKGDFSTFLQRNDFEYLKKPVPDNLKIRQEDIKIKVVHFPKRMGDFYPNSGLKKFLQMEKL